MLKKTVFWGLLICIVAASPVCAANVSFLVMETGPAPESISKQYPLLWENSLLDVFFEAGHIVSNSRLMRLETKPAGGFPNEAKRDYENARDGGMEFFIIAVVDYSVPNVSLRLFSTSSPRMIQEERFAIKTLRPNQDEMEYIKAAVRAIAVHLD